MTTYQIMSWHGIPVQVRAGGRRDRASKELSPRFQEAIDRAAMLAGLTGSDAYIEGFSWSQPEERAGTPAEVVEAVAAELEARFEEIDPRRTAAELRQGG